MQRMHTPFGELDSHDEFSIAHSPLWTWNVAWELIIAGSTTKMAHTTERKGAKKTWLPQSGTMRIQSWLGAQEARCYALHPILSSAKALRVQLQSR